jgi:hypothetical protein
MYIVRVSILFVDDILETTTSIRFFPSDSASETRKRNEEKKQERQKEIEAKRAAKKGPMKLGAKKLID